MTEKQSECADQKIHLSLCAWSGNLAEEKRRTAEMALASILLIAFIKAFESKDPRDYTYSEDDKVEI